MSTTRQDQTSSVFQNGSSFVARVTWTRQCRGNRHSGMCLKLCVVRMFRACMFTCRSVIIVVGRRHNSFSRKHVSNTVSRRCHNHNRLSDEETDRIQLRKPYKLVECEFERGLQSTLALNLTHREHELILFLPSDGARVAEVWRAW